MTAPAPTRYPAVTVLRRVGDPFEAETFEVGVAADEPSHVAVLNRLFYDSTVDLGGLVRIDGVLYICTRSGWRALPPGGGA